MIITFGEWLPDQPEMGSQGLVFCDNVIPKAGGYVGFPEYRLWGDGTDERPCGALEAVYASGADQFIGTQTKLFRRPAAGGSFADVSKVGGYAVATTGTWDFCQFGNVVIAVGGGASSSPAPQAWTLGSSSAFADLGGSPPKAECCAVVKDFVVFGHTYDATDGERADRIRWSGFGDQTAWPISAATQADLNEMNTDGGPVVRIVGGNRGIVFQERAVTFMEYAGPPVVFNMAQAKGYPGCVQPSSVVVLNGDVYYWSTGGVKRIRQDGTLDHIGAQKVDREFLVLLTSTAQRVIGAANERLNAVFWTIRNSAREGQAIVYIYWPETNRFTYANINVNDTAIGVSWLWKSTLNTPGSPSAHMISETTWDVYSQDDYASWSGEFDLTTGFIELIPGRVALVRGARPIAKLKSSTGTGISVRARMDPINGSANDVSSGGTYNTRTASYNMRAAGRYFQFSYSGNPSDTDFESTTDIIGIDVDVVPMGQG